jgi:hypothetical protein
MKKAIDPRDFGFKLTGEFGVFDERLLKISREEKETNLEQGPYPYAHPDFVLPNFSFDYTKIREEYERLGLFNGYRISANPSDERLSEAKPEKNFIILDLLRADSDWRDREEYRNRFPSYHAFLEFYFDRFLAQIKQYPETVWGDLMGEIENSRPWPKDFFRNKREAYEYWKWAQTERLFGDDPGKNHEFLINYEMEFLKKRGVSLKTSNLMIAGCTTFSCHYFYEWGFHFIWMETLAQAHHQDEIAFFRGAAKQHNGLWGIDNASHHPHFNATTWYDGKGRQRRGFSPSITLRNWMVSFLSGAHLLHQQASELSHFIYDESGTFRLSPHGENAKKFADFTLRDHPQRGETIVPIALFLNYYHGYNGHQSSSQDGPTVWAGRMPFSSEDANITNFLELFFPGHNRPLTLWENAWNPEAPWKDQYEWAEMMKEGKDMRPYEAYCLTASPFGDSVDVILDNAEPESLARYKILCLAGKQELNENISNRLCDYLENGGIIITSFAQIPSKLQEELGIVVTGAAWDYDKVTNLEDPTASYPGRRYVYSRLRVKNSTVLGHNSIHDPLLWEVPFGKGTLILSAIPYSQDITGSGLMPLCKDLYGRRIDRVVPVKTYPSTLQTITNKGDGFLLVGAFNNFERPWRGKIVLNGIQKSCRVEDIWNKSSIAMEKGTLSPEIPAYEFAIYKIPV